ncbi:MAG: (4Fe-4S)-binding protein [Anaerolineaceae bacterium]|nr:MAG: (4Fe-4S)-binding protein [Anaerolineaceae bacterium]
MRIVVASGKGGTGKTTVATSLALAAAEREAVRVLDCDVEAPNAALFLHPDLNQRKEVGILLPVMDEALCTHCGKCAEVCEFHAIAVIGKKTLVFPELCHGCGSCTLVCPEKAITERLDVMGVLESGMTASGVNFARGLMNVGEPMAVPIIRELKKWNPASLRAAVGRVAECIETKRRSNPLIDEETASGESAPRNGIEIRDAPPGASCPVVETMRGADFLLLVTEPTPFGLHDLKQVASIARELGILVGVVINRDGIGDDAVEKYCAENGLPILMKIPMERRFAEAIASGKTLVDAAPEYRPAFRALLEDITVRFAA